MTNLQQRADFSGKTIYVGMDVHLKSWDVSVFYDQQYLNLNWRKCCALGKCGCSLVPTMLAVFRLPCVLQPMGWRKCCGWPAWLLTCAYYDRSLQTTFWLCKSEDLQHERHKSRAMPSHFPKTCASNRLLFFYKREDWDQMGV